MVALRGADASALAARQGAGAVKLLTIRWYSDHDALE
jgi:hypothetical protein